MLTSNDICAKCRSQWLRQAHKLVVLCSGIVVMVQEERNAPATQISSKAASNQTLLMTAVARLVMVMTDVTAWKCFQSGKADN